MRLSLKVLWSVLPLVVGILTPSTIVFVLEISLARIPFAKALPDVASRQFAEGENLFALALIGLIPFALLSIFSLIMSRLLSPSRLAVISLGGLVGILAFMVPAHVSVWWPSYAGGHVSSTSAIAFLFIPFYCVGTLAAGLFIGWAVSHLPLFRRTKPQ